MFEKFSLPPMSSHAATVDNLYFFILITSVILLAVTTAVMLYFGWEYRVSKVGKDAVVPYLGGNHMFEFVLSVLCTAYFLIIFIWGMIGYTDFHFSPKDTYDISVTGKKWQWNVQYSNGKKSDELVVPKDTNIKLIMSSEDVIHSFFVPEFRMKQDVLPGMYTSMWFKATRTGEARVFCAEFCGANHSGMITKVRILEPSAFKVWLDGRDPDKIDLASNGRHLFEQRSCVACHDTNGKSSPKGPSLKGLFGKTVDLEGGTSVSRDEDYVRQSITNPGGQVVKGYRPIMPTYKGLMNEGDLGALVAYLKSLKE